MTESEQSVMWTCSGCGRAVTRAEKQRRHWGRQCNPCFKQATRGTGSWVENDREASRRWKREHLGQPGNPARDRRS